MILATTLVSFQLDTSSEKITVRANFTLLSIRVRPGQKQIKGGRGNCECLDLKKNMELMVFF